MSRPDQAVALFTGGLNCSQAVLAAHAPALGLDRQTALKIACGFGGGMRRAETCGAVTGALMVLGLRHGPTDAADQDAKAEVYRRASDFNDRFQQRCGTLICRDLLGCDISTPEGMQQACGQDLFKTRCVELVRAAAEILEEMIQGE